MPEAHASRSRLTAYAWLSVAAALTTIGLKTAAYKLTGSVGLLSDALESLVNLGSAFMAMLALRIAAQPADDGHPYGHDKAEYFSSGFEGAAILVTALLIATAAVPRVLAPQHLEQLGLGLALTVVASAINLAVSVILMRAGHKHDSVALQGEAHHLMTDVWTSAGIVLALALVKLTGWAVLDPLVALAVAAHIAWTGLGLVSSSVGGLMDAALPPPEQAAIEEVLESYRRSDAIQWHALRTRAAGSRRFVSVHILVPGAWSVKRGHDLAERIEQAMGQRLKRLSVVTHIEPLEDEASFRDAGLEREDA